MLLAHDKVVVVTGASAGLGRCLALEAGRRRGRVGLIARRAHLLEELRDTIRVLGGAACAIPTDVRDAQAVEGAFARIESIWGHIDILINNAAVVEPLAPLVQCSNEELLSALTTNVFGVYIATREALKRMIVQPTGGVVVNITGGTGRHPYPSWSAYCSQKAAVDMFTRCVAMEVSGRPVRVTAICPGSFDSHMQRAIRETSELGFPAREKFVRLYEEGKLADPEELAKVIVDLCLVDWPDLSGRVEDLRCADFRTECREHGVTIP